MSATTLGAQAVYEALRASYEHGADIAGMLATAAWDRLGDDDRAVFSGAGRAAIAMQTQPAPGETVHLSPPDGAHRTPCCGETPFDLMRTDRMTNDPSLVTCGGPEPQPAPGVTLTVDGIGTLCPDPAAHVVVRDFVTGREVPHEETAHSAPQPAPGLQAGEIVHLYHWRFDLGEEFGIFRHREDADAMAAKRAGEGLSEVLSMAILGRPEQPGGSHIGRSWSGRCVLRRCGCGRYEEVLRQQDTGQPPALYTRWYRIDVAEATDADVATAWRMTPAPDREFWRELDAAQGPQPVRDDTGTIRHIPTGATWITWDENRQPPWKQIAEAVASLTNGAVKIRAVSNDDPGRLAVAVYRELPELEDE
jgi:hypothetical protein